ncbi:MAG TPA: ABC transporter permease subunit [Tepidisphaeraceae bacterium]|jgi:ABC-type transport system involved in multi-copper enzyme maturation permease subunit|nr:ABC transporter permease subunit [Tepidisphaeraceae bacterium]
MLGITDYLWRLIPANPILLRVIEAGGKRRRDLFIRCIYLGLLILVVVFSLNTQATQLDQLTSISRQLFERMSYLQLALVALLSPIFTAGAITQEKDSQTYDILLATPLTNGQIVLGSLLSRLFFVIALLISGIPIFSITQIFGGVAIRDIIQSFNVAAATAFVTGSMAMAIATFKVGTRRTIFSFYFFIVLYLVGTALLDQLDAFKINLTTGALSTTSWMTGLNPFLALQTIFGSELYAPPAMTDLPPDLQGWPWGWYLARPAGFYITFMFFLSFVLVVPSIVMLRRLAQSTVSLRSWILQKLHVSKGATTRKPRFVWSNPIAWREAKTKASAARATLLRYGFMLAGVAGAVVLLWLYSSTTTPAMYIDRTSYDSATGIFTVYTPDSATNYEIRANQPVDVKVNGQPGTLEDLRRRMAVDVTTSGGNARVLASVTATEVPSALSATALQGYLLGATIVELAIILLIVTNAAASTVTREKEDGSLDLLLTTPITSRYYIWGKLRGLVSFVLPLIAVPLASVAIFIVYDMYRLLSGSGGVGFRWIVLPEALLILPGMFVIVCAFAAILGMQMSLRMRTTVTAVMASVGIVAGVTGTLGWCGYTFLESGRGSDIAVAIGSFSPFTLLGLLINPQAVSYNFNPANPTWASELADARVLIFIGSWIAIGIYTAVVWGMYTGMVKNFDMTIRRQSR